MRKKFAGAAVGTLLIASLLAGSALPAWAVAPAGGKAESTAPVAASEPAAEASPEYAAYLFVHFIDTEEDATKEQIYFSVSTDGTSWTTLNEKKPILTSTVGEQGVRDPHIIRKQNGGGFAIIATDLSIANRGGNWDKAQTGGSRDIVVWQSNTIDGWSGGGTLRRVSTEDMLDVWAPESVWDKEKEQYMVTWSSIIGDRAKKEAYNWKYRVYRSYTSDFMNYTKPEVYIERDYSVIDTTIYYNEEDETYYRFTKNEDNDAKWVFMEKGKSLSEPFEYVSTYRLDGEHYKEVTGVEGPTVYKSNADGKWFLLLDNWTYKPYETEDISKGVFTTAGEFTFNGPRFRHGSVLPITQDEYDALIKKYPTKEVLPTEPDKTSGDLIFDLRFENDAPAVKTGSYTVTPSGTFTYEQGSKSGTQAAKFSWTNQTFLTLDGSLFAGKTNLTLTFKVNIYDVSQTSWLFFAAANANQMNDPPTYYGTLLKDRGTVACERFLGGRSDDSYSTGVAGNQWLDITVVYYHGSTKLFIDGQLIKNDSSNRGTTTSTASLADIIGAAPVVYLGKATWSSGEYANMLLESFRVYDYAMSDADVAKQYAADNA